MFSVKLHNITFVFRCLKMISFYPHKSVLQKCKNVWKQKNICVKTLIDWIPLNHFLFLSSFGPQSSSKCRDSPDIDHTSE